MLSHLIFATKTPQTRYAIDDIVSYSKAWTGFVKRGERGGAASSSRGSGYTTLDPLKIEVATRDVFPKNDLSGGFIGDKVALCADLPPRHFLRRGATYLLLGSDGKPKLHDDPSDWSNNPDFLHLEVSPSSPLYAALSSLPSKVTLAENLDYSDPAAQAGAEYGVDTVRVLKLRVGTGYVWYEYVRPPCVEHSFFR